MCVGEVVKRSINLLTKLCARDFYSFTKNDLANKHTHHIIFPYWNIKIKRMLCLVKCLRPSYVAFLLNSKKKSKVLKSKTKARGKIYKIEWDNILLVFTWHECALWYLVSGSFFYAILCIMYACSDKSIHSI